MKKGRNVVLKVVNNGSISGILNVKWWPVILSARRQLWHYVLYCLYVWMLRFRTDGSFLFPFCTIFLTVYLRKLLSMWDHCEIMKHSCPFNIFSPYMEGNPSGLNSKPLHSSLPFLPKNPNYKCQTAYIRYLNVWLSRNTLTIWQEMWFVGGPREGGTIWM